MLIWSPEYGHVRGYKTSQGDIEDVFRVSNILDLELCLLLTSTKVDEIAQRHSLATSLAGFGNGRSGNKYFEVSLLCLGLYHSLC